eukprot:5888928-Prymnesium_polylepis.1
MKRVAGPQASRDDRNRSQRVLSNKGKMINGSSNTYHSGQWLLMTRPAREFVRHVMFPFDTQLLLAVCGREALSD